MMKVINRKIENVLKKTPQFTRIKRHVLTLLNHSTIKKLINLVAIESQHRMHLAKVKGYPYYLVIETGNVCNLKCPLCPTGLGKAGRKRGFIRFEDFKTIIDKLYPYLYEVSMYNWGEPFLNPDIFKMIRYVAEKNIGSNLSSNLNITDLDPEILVATGLEFLSLSLDGTTQEVYSKYRVGGEIALVLENLEKIVMKKKQLKSRKPFIEWQFIVMKHNYHQIENARKMAKEIGVDTIRFIPVGLPFGTENKEQLAREWFPYLPDGYGEKYIKERFLQKPIKGGCFYLYRSLTANPDGSVAPCCMCWQQEDDFGNILENDFSEVWNNALFQNARALFSKKQKNGTKTACADCPVFFRP
ncbi:MAG: radical SAM protein [Planctomycetota bacterium]|jgi:radical SAM protein with 4Fe4S-binding SPASM domain